MPIASSWSRPVLIAALALPMAVSAASAAPRRDARPLRANAIVQIEHVTSTAPEQEAPTVPAVDSGAVDVLAQIVAAGCRERQCPDRHFDSSASPVPEPDIYSLLLVGLGMVVFAARRAASVGANRTVSSSDRHGGAKLPFSD